MHVINIYNVNTNEINPKMIRLLFGNRYAD